MGQSGAAALAIGLALAMVTASHGAENGICKMSEAEAIESPACVRWYFSCMLPGLAPNPNPPPEYAALTFKDKQQLLVKATFGVAQQNCQQFDYEEASAALDANLRLLDN